MSEPRMGLPHTVRVVIILSTRNGSAIMHRKLVDITSSGIV